MSVRVCDPDFPDLHKITVHDEKVIITGAYASMWQVFWERSVQDLQESGEKDFFFTNKRVLLHPQMRYMYESVNALLTLTFRQSTKTYARVKTVTPRIVFLLMDLFLFYCIFYLTSLIKTDMVVVKPPVLIQSYQDILDSGVRPLWFAIADDAKEFHQAKQGSLEKRIWQQAEGMGLNDSLVQSSFKNIIPHAMRIAGMKEVLLVPQQMGQQIFTCNACAFSRSKGIMTDVNSLYRSDPETREKLSANIENHLFVKSEASNHVNHRNQLIFEADLLSASRRFFDFSSILQLDGLDRLYHTIMECCSEVVAIDSPVWQPVLLRHFASFWILTAICLLLALLSLLVEDGSAVVYARKGCRIMRGFIISLITLVRTSCDILRLFLRNVIAHHKNA
jgi:hypothetical protein